MKKNTLKTYAINEYDRWLEASISDEDFHGQLELLKDNEDELIDSFYCDLRFGTSGIRGIMGPGTNRMNDYVIKRTTQGLADYLNGTYKRPKVIIAYDSRKNSKHFAEETSQILSGNDIDVLLFPEIAPVSMLSFAITHLCCTMGIMITASHNPKMFNGYKVYNRHGYQIVGEEPDRILAAIDKIDFFDEVKKSNKRIQYVGEEICSLFLDTIVEFSPVKKCPCAEDISIVYTPLNGTGNQYVRSVLHRMGFSNVTVVASQELPDENFSTCAVPNPEKITAYVEAFKTLDQVKGDIVIATDPDCDRVGAAVYHGTMKVLLTGNQLGILLLDYLCKVKAPKEGQVLIKSIVTTPLAEKIGNKYGLKVMNTLTGFKYIGEIIETMETDHQLEDYYFGFEESNGYLMNSFIKDKDGVSTAMLVALMAAYHRSNNKDLVQRIREIYDEYGYCVDRTKNYFFEGPSGRLAMKEIMTFFRNQVNTSIGTEKIVEKIDYLNQELLPLEDVIEYRFSNDNRFIIRPSGTEAKIKVYLFESHRSSGLEKGIEDIIKQFKE